MAAMLKKAAASAVNKGAPSTFYHDDKQNPVFQALDQEIKLYENYMKKRTSPGYKLPNEEPSSRAADTLFELWNRYEARLPVLYYQRKLLAMGDFLVSVKEYNLALWQCYERYLRHFGDINVEEITDVSVFKKTYFPNGYGTEDAGFTFRALMGKSICTYQVIRQMDSKLQNVEYVQKAVRLLAFLRLITQVILPNEALCWLIYNGTVHIYSISRHMMSLGHSKKVLEYLLWACMCMESSVPLLGTRYLNWRATLYTAVCQCYYDCKEGHHAEAFARRALSKISELSQLESMSSAGKSAETEAVFRQATVRMAVMVFKRTVFETRRKPKGLLRPKTRANLKDAQGLPWPRTPSEKMLTDMFEGSAAQFLALVEALSDSNRRTLLHAPPAGDNEVEILDVYAELFMAAQELIAGGGNQAAREESEVSVVGMSGVVPDANLMEIATKGEDCVPLSSVIKIVKFAYCFEQWDVFESLIEKTMEYLKELGDPKYGPDEKCLELLLAVSKVSGRGRSRRLAAQQTGEDGESDPGNAEEAGLTAPVTGGQKGSQDHLMHLAAVLMSIITGPFEPSDLDLDMVVDASLLLWNKCKAVFQRYQTGSSDNARYLQKMDSPGKWVYILDVVHQALGWCGISSVDPALTAEVVLRLALVLEASAETSQQSGRKSSMKGSVGVTTAAKPKDLDGDPSTMHSMEIEDDQSLVSSMKDIQGSLVDLKGPGSASDAGQSHTSLFSASVLTQSSRGQLQQAREILELGIQNVSFARQVVALTDGKSIADITWAQDLQPELFAPVSPEKPAAAGDLESVREAEEEEDTAAETGSDAEAVWNTVKDLHLELLYMYHRVGLKLAVHEQDPKFSQKRLKGKPVDSAMAAYEELAAACHRNQLSRALLCMQKALLEKSQGKQQDSHTLLQEAQQLIRKAEVEQKRLYVENTGSATTVVHTSRVPPAPLLLCRTDTTMVFKPAPFTPQGGEKVAWYRLFARSATGSNVKVRLNDYLLPGTGEEVPSFSCELHVAGLTPGEKYVVAVAAYTADGQLIGNGVGETSKPILASHPLPVLMTWAYLAQVSYQVGCHDIAKEACGVLWNHFVAKPPPPGGDTYTSSAKKDFVLTLHRLNPRVVTLASPVLLRMFLTSIFIRVDVSVREGSLFCDMLCDKGPLSQGQLKRLQQCELMLVALELSGWLNEANLALQAVVQCYGLLVPLLYFRIPAVPVIQVLERCQAILQEIPVNLRQRRVQATTDSLHHMTACLTYHMAKVLRTWGQRQLANNINEVGRKLLALDKEDKDGKGEEAGEDPDIVVNPDVDSVEPVTDTGSLTLAALKSKKKGKKGGQQASKDEPEIIGNEELKALEAHMLRLSKQAQGEHELTGGEDPSILHAYIAYLPSRIAYKEVIKFKRRAQYLEYFVQVAQKALAEGSPDLALEWCDDAAAWLAKRNEQILGNRALMSVQPGVLTVAGDDPKKFAAALVEYQKAPKAKPGAAKVVPKTRRKTKYKLLRSSPNMTDAQRQAQEEKELQALDVLNMYFLDMYRSYHRRRRLRKVCTDEGPWRVHLNLVQALSQFGFFLHKMEQRQKIIGFSTSHIYDTNFLDHEWFTFETAGTLVVGWEGGPSRQHTREGMRGSQDSHMKKASGIEMAAMAATGKPPPPLYPIPQEVEDTPRTYRSETGKAKGTKAQVQEAEPLGIINAEETAAMLKKTFNFFNKAVVLAHRGQHWTLLQNSCRALWNCAHTALLRACISQPDGGPFLSLEQLRGLLWKPFYTATDCLLHMLVQLQMQQETAKKVKGKQVEAAKEPLEVKSVMGSVENERGGASVRFELPLDDLSSVDMRWLRRQVLRTLEMLYYEQKWERLADIALRFNAVSNERYAEQVNPLLIQAQRKLISRVEMNNGPKEPQPHFESVIQAQKGPITAKQYTTLQLKVEVEGDQLSQIDPGAHIDPDGHDAYSAHGPGGQHAMKLCRVPLDVGYSLQQLRQALDQSQYTARALQHSRRLLVLYLSGQQNAKEEIRTPSHVDFRPNTARPQPSMPPDLSKELFLSMDDVQTSPMPRSQVGVVISSYDKTIELLLASKQTGLAAEAMREVGNLHYHMGNVRGAYKWWADALDTLLHTKDAVHKWRSITAGGDLCEVLLQKCGLWGCVLGGIVASNIAQYVLMSDLGLRSECCFLSGFFYKALFRASLPHPRADRDYAMYEVGEGCEVTNLIPGIDLLSDRFRCDGRTLVASLRFVMEELARGRHNLFVLPLLTLYQYVTTFVCRDLQRAVDGRILRVRVLTDLGLYTEAFIVLQRLLHGERLPHTADSNFRQVESRSSSVKFNTSKPLLEPVNLKVMEQVIDKRLSSSLGTLYGPHLTCHLSLVQAHLFVSLADTIPVLPSFEDIVPPGSSGPVQPHTISTMSKGGLKTKASSIIKPTPSPKKELPEEDETVSDQSMGLIRTEAQRFTARKKPVTPEVIKGTLLATADQILNTLNDILVEVAKNDKGLEKMSAAETELVVLCKLELAAVAQQRHHAALAAHLVLGALKILQSSDILKEKKSKVLAARRVSSLRGDRLVKDSVVKLTDPETSQYQYQNFQSRARLDARLWLTCRKALVKSMLGEIRGMGQVKGPERMVKVELADVRQYVAEGIAESEVCGDVEMQAEFLMFAVALDHMEGQHVSHIIQTLEEVDGLLEQVPQLSTPGCLLQALAQMQAADLQAAMGGQGVLQAYLQVHHKLLQQLEAHGERIEHHYPMGEKLELSTPCSPIQNLYLMHLLPLIQVKLRVGHTLARQAATTKHRTTEAGVQWCHPLGVLTTALEMSQVIVSRVPSVETEILLTIGKVQRQLLEIGKCSCQTAADSLLQAIYLSYLNDHNLGLMRQAYLELALVYLSSGRPDVTRETSMGESILEEGGESTTSQGAAKSKRRQQRSKKDKASKVEDSTNEKERDRKAAFVAIRCAAAVGEAQRSRALLIGDNTAMAQPISNKANAVVPEFLALDLVSSYVLGEKKRVYKNEIEEELAPLTEAMEPQQVESYEEQVKRARDAAQELSWVHFLGYQSFLQRLSSTATLTVTQDKNSTSEEHDLSSQFDLGFISHVDASAIVNLDVVQTMLFSPGWTLRLGHLHQYLSLALPQYASSCVAVYPPAILQPKATEGEPGVARQLSIISKSYGDNKLLPVEAEEGVDMGPPLSAPSSVVELPRPSDKVVVNPADSDICLQWYQPALDAGLPDTAESSIMLLWALTSKADKTGPVSTHCGNMWLPFKQVADLHDRLSVLGQRGEISLEDKQPAKEKKEVAPSRSLTRKQTRIKALSPKLKKDEKLEALLRQCMIDAQQLFDLPLEPDEGVTEGGPETSEPVQPVIPFDVSRSNMHHFERMFDPSNGHLLKEAKMLTWFSRLFLKPAEKSTNA